MIGHATGSDGGDQGSIDFRDIRVLEFATSFVYSSWTSPVFSVSDMRSPNPYMNLTVIRSADLEKSATFYRALGLDLKRESHGTGPVHYSHESDGHTFEIYPAGTQTSTAKAIRIGFSVSDLESTLEKIVVVGGEIRSIPKETPWGRRAIVLDPDGHVVEIVSMPAC